MKNYFSLFIASIFLFLNVNSIFAQSPSPSPIEEQENINSFDLFWPVVAGRTMGDSLYPLKTAKESLRGMLIFGKGEKADHQIFLATKRIVEGEKLVNDVKKDNAIKTFNKAKDLLSSAEKNIESAKAGKGIGQPAGNITNQISNLEKFLTWYLKSAPSDYSSVLTEILSLTTSIKSKL